MSDRTGDGTTPPTNQAAMGDPGVAVGGSSPGHISWLRVGWGLPLAVNTAALVSILVAGFLTLGRVEAADRTAAAGAEIKLAEWELLARFRADVEARIRQKDAEIRRFEHLVATLDGQIAVLRMKIEGQKVVDGDGQVEALLAEREAAYESLEASLRERDSLVDALRAGSSEHDSGLTRSEASGPVPDSRPLVAHLDGHYRSMLDALESGRYEDAENDLDAIREFTGRFDSGSLEATHIRETHARIAGLLEELTNRLRRTESVPEPGQISSDVRDGFPRASSPEDDQRERLLADLSWINHLLAAVAEGTSTFEDVVQTTPGRRLLPDLEAAVARERESLAARAASESRLGAMRELQSLVAYLSGSSIPSEEATRDHLLDLAEADPEFRSLIEGIQRLAEGGLGRPELPVGRMRFVGVVMSVEENSVTVDPIAETPVGQGATTEIRRTTAGITTVLARGEVIGKAGRLFRVRIVERFGHDRPRAHDLVFVRLHQ